MPWRGVITSKDAILVKRELVKEDYYTSNSHRGIRNRGARTPSSGRKRLRATSPTSPIRSCATWTKAGITPHRGHGEAGRHSGGQGDSQGRGRSSLPKRKLLRAIFGEKAGDVKDARCTAAWHRRHHRRLQDFLAQGQEKGRAFEGHRGMQIQRLAGEPAGRNPHPDRRARQAVERAAGRTQSCWPTCTTKDQQAPALQGYELTRD